MSAPLPPTARAVLADVGAEIRAARAARGLSGVQCSVRLGIDPSHLTKIETGVHRPSRELMVLIGAELRVSGDQLDRWLWRYGHAPLTDWQTIARSALDKLHNIRLVLA